MAMAAGTTDTDVVLAAESDGNMPTQTSSAQTADFSYPIITDREKDHPFLVEASYTGEYPAAPEKKTLVKAWYLVAIHSNSSFFVYNYGSWGKFVSTSGSIVYSSDAYAPVKNLVEVQYIQPGKIRFNVKAARSDSVLQNGAWHVKVYRLSW